MESTLFLAGWRACWTGCLHYKSEPPRSAAFLFLFAPPSLPHPRKHRTSSTIRATHRNCHTAFTLSFSLTAMSNGARPFYILITLFAFVQIISHLWPKHHSRSSSPIGSLLFKRAEPESECEDVWLHDDRCAFVEEHCTDLSGLINYPHLYFCNLSSLPALALIIMVGLSSLIFFRKNKGTSCQRRVLEKLKITIRVCRILNT